MNLTRAALGRVLLHLGYLLRGRRWEFHWVGVQRDLANMSVTLNVAGGCDICLHACAQSPTTDAANHPVLWRQPNDAEALMHTNS